MFVSNFLACDADPVDRNKKNDRRQKGIGNRNRPGTTYSCVAVWQQQHNRVEIIHNDQGNNTTPSCVAFTDHERLIGDAAKNQAASNPENTIFDIVVIEYILEDLKAIRIMVLEKVGKRKRES
ncbi:hypothetical protein V8G54_017964 [Vigna mungo]|uniref:Heat shock protein 70 n=1 Tax=Vigna mungo TaxID=3915 RepID=A0AAQ3N9K3_VIGMU